MRLKMDNFYTIQEENTSVLTEKKSKFIAHILFIENKTDAINKIEKIRKKYFDAKHNCYAYRIIENNNLLQQASDDGEPSGTAGLPMLQILQKNNLCNILVVITRYFGGILLGTGGLVRAYSQSTKDVIDKSKKIEMTKGRELVIELDYNTFNFLQYFCKKNKVLIDKVEYSTNIVCKIIAENSKIDEIIKVLKEKEIKVKNNYLLSIKYFKKVY